MRRAACLAAVVLVSTTSCVAGDQDDGRVVAPPTEAAALSIIDPIQTTSPDGSVRIEVGVLEGGAAAYRLVRSHEGVETVVVDTSPVGLDTSDGSFLAGLTVADPGTAAPWSSDFESSTGRRRVSSLDGMARTVRFAGSSADTALELDVVAVDHGAAFRTRLVPTGRNDGAGPARTIVVEAERTGFDLPADAIAWLQPHDEASSFTPAYERIVPPARPLASPVPSREGWTLPALMEHEGSWTLLAEAGLEAGWAGSHLRGVVDDGDLALAFPSAAEGFGVGDPRPRGELPITSPWRVVMTSDSIADIVESDLIRHLSAAPDDRDWSWVEPGRSSWSWWADAESSTDADRLIEYVEFSAEVGWEYSLIDANWNVLPDDEFSRVVARADELGVGLLLWYNSGGSHNDVTEAPRGLMSSPEIRRAELERISALGIRGIKVDFFHSDKPDRIEQYLGILADAAEVELLVNFHGSTVPRGWSRTWPNLMTMEAVAGAEQYLFNRAYASLAPRQNTVLPFLRNVVGPMDFTPTTLDDELARSTSNAHELALSIVFESGLQHLVDTPEVYRAQPDVVRSMLADLPTAWDDTVLLDGRPDSHVVMARRRGDVWWVGAINGPDDVLGLDLAALLATDGRTADLDPDVVRVACDGDAPRTWAVEERQDLPDPIDIAPSGGCAFVVG